MEDDRMLTDVELVEFSTQISEIKQMVDGYLTESNRILESQNRRHEEFMAQIRNMLLNPSQINPPPAFEPLSSLVNPDSVETAEIKINDVDTAVSTEEEVREEKEELQTLGNVSYVQIESTDFQFPQDEANVTGNQLNIPLLVIWSGDEYMDPYLHPTIDGLKILDIICTPTVCRNASMDLPLHYASLSLKCSQYNLVIFMPWRIIHIDLDKPPPLPPETMQDECYSSMQCIKSRDSRNGWKIDVKCEMMPLEPTIRRMGCLKDMLMAEDMSHCRRFEWVPKVMDSYIYSIGFNVNSDRLVCGGLTYLALKDGADFISFGGNLQHGSQAGGIFVGLIGHLFLIEHVLKINTHSSTDFSEYSTECLGLDYSNCSQVITSVDALVLDSSNGKSYLKAKDVQVDEVLLYENTNSDMNKQHYLTLRSDCLVGIVILFDKCKILEVKPSNRSQSLFVLQIINEPMKVVFTDSLGGSIQLEFFLFSALKPPEFTVLQLKLSFFFVGFQSADFIHIELDKPPPLPPDPEYAYGFDTVLWQAVNSTNILFEVTVEKEALDLIELTNPEQQLSSSKLIVEFDVLIGRRGKRLLIGQNFDIYQLTEFVKTGFGGEVELKLGCVVDGHWKVRDKRQKKKGIGGSTVDSQCSLKSAAPEINGWKNFTRSGWPGVSDNLQRLSGWENRRLQLPNYTFLNRYRALDAVQQPLNNRWLDQLVEVGYYDVGRVRRPLTQMQDQTHSGFSMTDSQVEHFTYGNSRYESSMNNMIAKDKITGSKTITITGVVSQSYVNAIVATMKIKCTIQFVGWSFIGFMIVKLLTLRTRSFSKRRGMLPEGVSSYLRDVRVK